MCHTCSYLVPQLGTTFSAPVTLPPSVLRLLSRLVEVACFDSQVALILLRMCGGYCKLVYLARATPPNLASDPLQLFDAEVRECFTLCTVVPVSNLTWQQAQLSLSHGGLGLHSVSHHSLAAYIASLCSFGFANGITNTLLARLIVSTVLFLRPRWLLWHPYWLHPCSREHYP